MRSLNIKSKGIEYEFSYEGADVISFFGYNFIGGTFNYYLSKGSQIPTSIKIIKYWFLFIPIFKRTIMEIPEEYLYYPNGEKKAKLIHILLPGECSCTWEKDGNNFTDGNKVYKRLG